MIPPALLFLLKIVLAFPGLFVLQMNFRIDYLISVKNDTGIFHEACNESVDCFWEYSHFYDINSAST
jgi:hypothetical protein